MARSSKSIYTAKRIHSGAFFESSLSENDVASAIAKLSKDAKAPVNALLITSVITGIEWRVLLNALRGVGKRVKVDASAPSIEVYHRFSRCSLLDLAYPLPHFLSEGLLNLLKSSYSEAEIKKQIALKIRSLGKGISYSKLKKYIYHIFGEAKLVHLELITGTLTKFSPAVHYYPIEHKELVELCVNYQRHLLEKAGVQAIFSDVRPPSGWSCDVVDTALVGQLLRRLKQQTFEDASKLESRKDRLEQLNWWSCFMLAMIEVCLGCRPNHPKRWRIPELLQYSIRLEEKGPNSRRVLPIPKMLKEASDEYITYLQSLKHFYPTCPSLQKQITMQLEGKLPAFAHFSLNEGAVQIEPMTKQLRKKWLSDSTLFTDEMLSLPDNFGRRYLQHQVREQFSFSISNRWFGYCAAYSHSPEKVGGQQALKEVRDYVDQLIGELMNEKD